MANGVTTQTSTLATVPGSTIVATVDADTAGHVQSVTAGGNTTSAAATAGKATDTVIKNAPGILCRVLVVTANTNPMIIYDHASAGSGTPVGIIPANTPAGAVLAFDMPCALGITVDGHANNPAVTISFV